MKDSFSEFSYTINKFNFKKRSFEFELNQQNSFIKVIEATPDSITLRNILTDHYFIIHKHEYGYETENRRQIKKSETGLGGSRINFKKFQP